MTSIDDAMRSRWTLIQGEDVVGQFVRGNAIPDYFIQHEELGSPIAAETDWDGVEGGRLQAFVNGVIGWDLQNGARVIRE